jgi:beta-lactamase regulating signal transducer with metallopeptidase domain
VEANVHEHIARAMYYFSVHLLYASVVGAATWLLTSIRGASATTKYWIWVVTAFNFILPVGATVDKVWGQHFHSAAPLSALGGPIWEITQGRTAVVLAAIWIAGTFTMLVRLISRLRSEGREAEIAHSPSVNDATSGFTTNGIPVNFDARHPAPAVSGIFYPCILLPIGIDRLLNQREFHAVLLHEFAHARRRDNLIRVLYEFSLCAVWFHPLLWLAGARMALYRELSCDETVIEHAHGTDLVAALAKLAVPERSFSLQATASSHLSYRLAGLSGQQQVQRASSLLLASLFAVVMAAALFGTVAHTACCFILRH